MPTTLKLIKKTFFPLVCLENKARFSKLSYAQSSKNHIKIQMLIQSVSSHQQIAFGNKAIHIHLGDEHELHEGETM